MNSADRWIIKEHNKDSIVNGHMKTFLSAISVKVFNQKEIMHTMTLTKQRIVKSTPRFFKSTINQNTLLISNKEQ